MKKQLEHNLRALNKVIIPLFYKTGNEYLKIAAKRPVRIKAAIEKLIGEGKMDRGKVIQYDNCVIYYPNGIVKFIDENNII